MTHEELLDQDNNLKEMNPYTAYDLVPGFKEFVKTHYFELLDTKGKDLEFKECNVMTMWEVNEKLSFRKTRTVIDDVYSEFIQQRDNFYFATVKSYQDDAEKFREELKYSIYEFSDELITAFIESEGITNSKKVNESGAYAINMIFYKLSEGFNELRQSIKNPCL
jgi:hypothetical protein